LAPPPPLPEPLAPPLLDPPLPHWLEQFWLWHVPTACPADGQLPSWAFEPHPWSRLPLKLPPGHTQLKKSLHALSALLICEPQWL
jgi:hypothetical protein